MPEETQHQTQEHHPHRPQEGHRVEVTVDHTTHHVYPGPNVVSTFKEIVHVPASDILEEVLHGHAKPLDDGATIEINGGEVFISRLREHKVEVTVDHKPRHVFPGSYVVSTFKEIVHVPASKVLEQVIAGELKLLADNETIEIKGGEVFISHVRTGGSSR
jgi:hypothetical protein